MLLGKLLEIFSSRLWSILFPQHAFRRRKYRVPGSHWLEAASDQYDMEDISDFKAVYKVGFFFLFYPMYWSLFDQQGSQWTIQAMRMNGYTWGLTILPDQFQVVNPILILVCIPLFNRVIYPCLGELPVILQAEPTKDLFGDVFQALFQMPNLCRIKLSDN